MNVLAFDTAFDACSVAAGRGLRSLSPSISCYWEAMSAGHAERLTPMISAAMTETGMAVDELDLIAVTTGPGTFTGTRIAIAAARALALPFGIPLVPVSSLRLMAMNMAANATGAAELAVAVDARRGEVYFERFDPHTLRSLAAPEAVTVEEAARRLPSGVTVVAGSGAAAVTSATTGQGKTCEAVAAQLLPDAFDLLFLAMELPRAASADAMYLRPPDAKPQPAAALARIR